MFNEIETYFIYPKSLSSKWIRPIEHSALRIGLSSEFIFKEFLVFIRDNLAPETY